MPTPRRDPSGPATVVTMRLSPLHLALLDAQRGDQSRRDHVEQLLELYEAHVLQAATATAQLRERMRLVVDAQQACSHWRTLRRDGRRWCADCGATLKP